MWDHNGRLTKFQQLPPPEDPLVTERHAIQRLCHALREQREIIAHLADALERDKSEAHAMLYALEEQRGRKHQEVSALAEKLSIWQSSGQDDDDYDRHKLFHDRLASVREKAEIDKRVRQERIQQAEMNLAAAADEVRF